MQGSFFSRTADLIRQSGMVFVIWFVALGTACVGAHYGVEDYMTSVYGYQMWPSRHVFESTVWVGAMAPQLGQIFFAYLALDDKEKWWCWAMAGMCMLVDSVPDVMYKTIPDNPASLWATPVEVFVMYTVASEMFLTLGIGLTIELWPDAILAWRELRMRVRQAVPSRGKWGMTGRGGSMARPQPGRTRPGRPMERPQSSRGPRSPHERRGRVSPEHLVEDLKF